jgi:hypothetical protein
MRTQQHVQFKINLLYHKYVINNELRGQCEETRYFLSFFLMKGEFNERNDSAVK